MLTSEGASLSVLTSFFCGMRGNRTATAVLRSQTGFEDRPGHQAHAFLVLRQSLLHRLPVAAGEYSYVAGATGDAAGI